MKKYKAIAKFYRELLMLLRKKRFDKTAAESIVAIFQESEEFFSWTKLDLKQIRDVYYNLQDRKDMARQAFEDLASYLKKPEARSLAFEFINIAELNDHENVFVHVMNRRLLCEESGEHGPAIVTIMVNAYNTFEDLIGAVQPPEIHGSFGEDAPTI
ncbi:MAG: hypothetical protein V4697_01630 [Patescibacteria group bacterium]